MIERRSSFCCHLSKDQGSSEGLTPCWGATPAHTARDDRDVPSNHHHPPTSKPKTTVGRSAAKPRREILTLILGSIYASRVDRTGFPSRNAVHGLEFSLKSLQTGCFLAPSARLLHTRHVQDRTQIDPATRNAQTYSDWSRGQRKVDVVPHERCSFAKQKYLRVAKGTRSQTSEARRHATEAENPGG